MIICRALGGNEIRVLPYFTTPCYVVVGERFTLGGDLLTGMEPIQVLLDAQANLRSYFRVVRSRDSRGSMTGLLAHLAQLQRNKGSGDVFYLGSGPSVWDLDTSDFDRVKESLSIASGFWILHPFRPDVYYYEGCVNSEGRALWDLHLRQKMPQYKNTYMVVPRSELIRNDGQVRLDRLQHHFQERLFAIEPFYLSARSKVSLDTFAILRRAPVARNHLVHFRGSLALVVDLASRLPATRRIILLGVDLRGGYFWHRMGISYQTYQTSSKGPNSVHMTAQRINGSIPIQDYLGWMRDHVLTPKGIKLEVSSSQSVLTKNFSIWHRTSN